MSQPIVRKLSFAKRPRKSQAEVAWVPSPNEVQVLNVLDRFVTHNNPDREDIHGAIRCLTEIADANQLSPTLKKNIKDRLNGIDKERLPSQSKIDYANFVTFT